MTAGSLFAGIGGFDLALERAGMETKWQCEIDKICRSVLARHFNATQHMDVRTLSKTNAEPVDLICGGFPCQDLSVAGRRAGLAGDRSGLWREYHRILAELHPAWFIIENVPGLLSSNGGRDFAAIISGLVSLGYSVAWRVLDAQYSGLAQRRKRVWIVGSLREGCAAKVLFEPESVSWGTPPGRETREGAAATLSGGADSGGKLGGRRREGDVNIVFQQTIFNPQSGGDQRLGITEDGSPSLQRNQIPAAIVPIGFKQGAGAKAGSIGAGEDVSPTLSSAESGANRVPAVAWEMTHADEVVREHGDISPTPNQRMGTGGNQVPMIGIRRLMPIECERLQGFPDGWTATGADGKPISGSARYRMLGNAVPVPVVEWIAKRIMQIENEFSPTANNQ